MSCAFCDQIAGQKQGDVLAKVVGVQPYRRLVVDENALAVVLPSIGPLAVGHFLVCPRGHRKSFAESSDAEQQAADELLDSVTRALGPKAGTRTIVFEHGSSRTGAKLACSIEHAHIHILPWPTDPWPLLQHRFNWIPSTRDELSTIVGDKEYLRYRCGDRWMVTLTETGFKSQLMRRILAETVGFADWDWRRSPRAELILESLALFNSAPQKSDIAA